MKKYFTFFLILSVLKLFAQDTVINDSMVFLAKPKEHYPYYKSINDLNYKINPKYPEGANTLLVIGLVDFNTYKAIEYTSEEEVYIPRQNINFLDNDRQEYLDNNVGDENIRRDFALYLLYENKLRLLKQEVEKYEGYQKKGIVITEKEYSYEEYSDAFGLKLEFYNGYKKDIKYIDLTIRSYNRVGDPINDYFLKNVVRPQVIGPIRSDSSSTVEFSDLFYDKNDVIDYLVITYMKITFMDGTIKEIKDVNNHLAKGVYNGKGK